MCDIPIAIKANPIKAATTEALCVGQKSIRAPKILLFIRRDHSYYPGCRLHLFHPLVTHASNQAARAVLHLPSQHSNTLCDFKQKLPGCRKKRIFRNTCLSSFCDSSTFIFHLLSSSSTLLCSLCKIPS